MPEVEGGERAFQHIDPCTCISGNGGSTVAKSLLERSDGVKIVVDQMSLQYLMGTEVDYVEGLQGAGFKFGNPNVKSTCGCGSSFSV